MKITSNLTGETLDTDKMSDIKALILEKGKEVFDLCSKNKKMCLFIVDLDDKVDGTGYNFYGYNNLKYNVKIEREKNESFGWFLQMVNSAILQISDNNFSIQSNQKD